MRTKSESMEEIEDIKRKKTKKEKAELRSKAGLRDDDNCLFRLEVDLYQ